MPREHVVAAATNWHWIVTQVMARRYPSALEGLLLHALPPLAAEILLRKLEAGAGPHHSCFYRHLRLSRWEAAGSRAMACARWATAQVHGLRRGLTLLFHACSG